MSARREDGKSLQSGARSPFCCQSLLLHLKKNSEDSLVLKLKELQWNKITALTSSYHENQRFELRLGSVSVWVSANPANTRSLPDLSLISRSHIQPDINLSFVYISYGVI